MIGGFSMVSLLLVFLAGVGAGFVGYAVGASSLVSYPALLAFGIPPVLANATNTVGVVGTGFGGALGARVELKGQRPRVIAYIAIGVVGGVLGALLLLGFDPTIFEHAVPPLILMSTLLIAVNPRGRMEARQAARDVLERTASGHAVSSGTSRTQAKKQIQPMSKDPWWLWIAVSFCGMYSGYFGAGAGTLVLAMLDLGHIGSFHQINALKTLVGFGANISASVIFICRGVVVWPAAIAMCVGCFLGSYIAPPITRRIPAKIMRIAAVVAGLILTADLAVKAYL
ncbi:MAG: sulfite exporter TauE/SafE family protein [Bifidobacteriaceae bacterium]|nr:sulfite exporter TauE/SafE family protein [Bifidobacteriaceae bacterium]